MIVIRRTRTFTENCSEAFRRSYSNMAQIGKYKGYEDKINTLDGRVKVNFIHSHTSTILDKQILKANITCPTDIPTRMA